MAIEDTIKAFSNGKNPCNQSSNVWSRGGILYSYGYHFPLAVRRVREDGSKWYLLNADKYSVSTSRHQNYTFQYFPNSPRVSFSALSAAGIDYKTVELADHTADYSASWDARWARETFAEWKSNTPQAATIRTQREDDGNGNIVAASAHLVGGAILQTENDCYVCGMDEGSYFMSQLPRKAKTITQGLEMLKPSHVKRAEKENRTIVRQGEFYFVRQTDDDLTKRHLSKRQLINTILGQGSTGKDYRGYVLPQERTDSNRHIATRGFMRRGQIFVTGTVKHKNSWDLGQTGEHETVKLGADIYQVFVNTALGSWSADGTID